MSTYVFLQMTTTISATALRNDLYNLIDQVLITGEPIQVKRKTGSVTIAPNHQPNKLDNLRKRKCIVGDPDELIHFSPAEWKPFL